MPELTAQQTRRLNEVNEEIELLEFSKKATLKLGQSYSFSGTSANFADIDKINTRLDMLRQVRNSLESLRDGTPMDGSATGMLRINFLD